MSSSTRASAWYMGTVLAVVVILGGSWIGYSSGQFAEATRLQEETDQAAHQNALLQARVQALQADYAKLDDYKAEIADLRVGIPSEIQLSELVRDIHKLAERFDVLVENIQPVAPSVIVPTPPPAAEPVEDAGENAASTEGGESSPTPAPTSTGTQEDQEAVIEGFAGVPIMFTAIGDALDVAGWIEAVQTDLDRLFLVTTIREERLDESGPSGALPEILEGYVRVDLSGYVFVLADPLAEEDEETAEGTLPRPTDRNPFLPIEGEKAPSGSGSGTED
jgi:Tfp pilus assembly protein PilO